MLLSRASSCPGTVPGTFLQRGSGRLPPTAGRLRSARVLSHSAPPRLRATRGAAERGGMTFVDEVKNAVTVRAALLVIGVLGLMVAFIASYAGAFHSPKPKDIPFAVVAPAADQRAAHTAAGLAARRPAGRTDGQGRGRRHPAAARPRYRRGPGRRPAGHHRQAARGERRRSLARAGRGGDRDGGREGAAAHREGGRRRARRRGRLAHPVLVLPRRRLVRGRLSVRRDPGDQRGRPARQHPSRADPARGARGVLDRRGAARLAHHRAGARRAAGQLHRARRARRARRVRGGRHDARLPGARRGRRHRPGDPGHRRPRQSERGRRLSVSAAPAVLAGDRARRCRRARAPGRRAPSRTSGARRSAARSWCSRSGRLLGAVITVVLAGLNRDRDENPVGA